LDASESYRLLECIGEGLGGPVYRAEAGSATVAVRQFRSPSPAGSPEWRADRQHFLDAGRQAQSLKHNRIVPVLEVIDEAGEAFHVMEFQPSGNLQTALHAQRMAPAEADVLLRQAAIALDFAHGSGVVHGDLKPSNIFVSPQQGAKVADFAISPRARRDRRSLPPNMVHAYLSPESLRNPSTAGAPSDQYSLAAIAYEMYTGQSPYGPASSAPQSAILNAVVAPPSRVNRQLPSSVDAPLLRALNRDPAQRFGSCLEFVATLDAGLISQPERRPSAGSPKLLWAGIASLLAALLALFLLWPSRKAPVAAVAPAPPPPAAAADTKKTPASGKARKKSATDAPVARNAVAGSANKPTPFGDLPSKAIAAATPQVQAALRAAAAPANKTQPQPLPAAPAPSRIPPPAPISSSVATRGFTLGVLSRDRPVGRDSTFSLGDPQLGELGAGDLKASIQYEGGQPPKGTLALLWSLDGQPMGVPKRVAPNQVVEYGNEPTAGAYTVTLLLDLHPVQTFTFRITP
jgi:serine/threonine protein kinase